MYCVEHKGRRHPVYKKKHYYYLLLLCRWNIYYSSFLVYTVAMNFNHFGGQTDFGMLEMDIPVLCQQLKKEISFKQKKQSDFTRPIKQYRSGAS